ncbi:Uncharacterised protein [BD1-7 clade bacterium]|uniref:AAA+ ATPase domain-containing protein n=1 Tax=BD1-7 clade bacterium TaxID=2029982 RepID=A0A5S9Q3M0_9GAMM|nr:Uncharacterised protein [BD1-7 clade bacterium]CAA0112168.1 Uncharacterised protein [BD1-7 clade bacterium]
MTNIKTAESESVDVNAGAEVDLVKSSTAESGDNTNDGSVLMQGNLILARLRTNIARVFIGQTALVDDVLVALLARGHVLIEGVPGLGKTLLVQTLAQSISAQFKRVQFTPDLMPADITGHSMFDRKDEQFKIRKGPAFTNFLLADEINRAPAKTQAALLEVMQERAITIEGRSLPTPSPFMVLATQNPIEHEGTYPLPEAQLDRFMMKLFVDYPNHEDEIALTRLASGQATGTASVDAVLTSQELLELQNVCAAFVVDDALIDYAVRLSQATREHSQLFYGAGPRASIALVSCARARAMIEGRDFVLPDDIKSVARPVLRHRVRLNPAAEIGGLTIDSLLDQILNTVETPKL